MKTTIYELSDIKPVGNFDVLLEKFNSLLVQLEEENKYSSRVAKFIKMFVGELGTLEILEEFDEPYTGWNMEEQKICLLYAHLLVIRANNIAQKYLNNIEMLPNHIQLMDYVNDKPKLKKVFGKLIIE
jgi:hypothetical protein